MERVVFFFRGEERAAVACAHPVVAFKLSGDGPRVGVEERRILGRRIDSVRINPS